MINISKQQARIRFRTLPPRIQDSIFSEADADTIQKIGLDNHLSQEKISGLALILSYIFLGFIHASDLKKQIEENLHINPQAADALVKIVDAQLIEPYREDLEKVYHPLSEEDFGLKPDRRQDNRGPAPLPTTAPRPVTLKVEGSIPAPKISGTNIPKPAPIVSGPPTPSAPFSFNKKQESQPINTPQDFKLRASIPTPQRTSVPTPPPTKPAQVELGRINVALENKQSSGKIDIGREPIKYSEPKSIFMPPAPPKPTIPTPPPRPENKTISPPPVPSPIPPPPIKK